MQRINPGDPEPWLQPRGQFKAELDMYCTARFRVWRYCSAIKYLKYEQNVTFEMVSVRLKGRQSQ